MKRFRCSMTCICSEIGTFVESKRATNKWAYDICLYRNAELL